MNEKRKRFWRVPIGEALVWPLPALLAAFSHLYAFPKAGMPGTGPGVHLALMNDKTIAAQRAWHFVDSLPHFFSLYALLLMAFFILLRLKHVRVPFRIAMFVLLAIPGLWYSNIASYLGGKIMTGAW